MCKKCNKCLIDKSMSEFSKDKSHSDGYSSICKICKKYYLKQYNILNSKKNYDKNKSIILSQKKEYYNNNKEIIKTKNAKYRSDNKEKVYKMHKKYQKTNSSLIKKRRREYEKNKRDTNKLYHLTVNIRGLIRNSLKYKGVDKKSRTHDILGCTFQEFKEHIELQFKPWMTWENYGKYNGELNYGWDLDHITPTSSSNSEEDIIKLNHYTNFQPLCSNINRNIKKNKIIF